MRFPTMWYVRPAKPQINLRIRAVWSEALLVVWIIYECEATDWISFGVSKLKRRLHMLAWVYTCQKATLLEITCHGLYEFPLLFAFSLENLFCQGLCPFFSYQYKKIWQFSEPYIKHPIDINTSCYDTKHKLKCDHYFLHKLQLRHDCTHISNVNSWGNNSNKPFDFLLNPICIVVVL